LELCSSDTTTVRITYTYNGGCKEIIVASAYLPYDSAEPPPTKELRDIINYCHNGKKQLIIGCDANASHTFWGSTGSNRRRESHMEFLVSSKLNILNCGNEPTFVVCNRKEVIDLTLGTNKIVNLVSNRHVSINQFTFRNPRRTNWESHKDNLKVKLEKLSRRIRMIKTIHQSVGQMQRAIISPYYHNCSAKQLAHRVLHFGGIIS
jgi:hypothetical protein